MTLQADSAPNWKTNDFSATRSLFKVDLKALKTLYKHMFYAPETHAEI